MTQRDIYDSISVFDYRYYDKAAAEYLSANAVIRYQLRVELALVQVRCNIGLCTETVVKEVERACSEITAEEVYAEEDRIHHDIRALVNCIQRRVGDEAKPHVHAGATSYDIIDTANAMRYRDIMHNVIIPELLKLEFILLELAQREANTSQIGRTHGQHAVPITFGFAIAPFVSRLGGSIEALKNLVSNLRGKFSGAVGAYNSTALFFENPRAFEAKILLELELIPAEISTQIAPPEPLMRLLDEVGVSAGILGHLARDMRNLQRTEIAEIGEAFGADQVGSSTMPQKRNPINFENVESMWKIITALLLLLPLDQISDHQRDLTGSASGRMYAEIFMCFVSMIKRMTRTMSKLVVDHQSLDRNLAITKGSILAEPLYLILASLGHPDAHEAVRKLAQQARDQSVPLEQIVADNEELAPYIQQMTARQRAILSDPLLYRGIAQERAEIISQNWKAQLQI